MGTNVNQSPPALWVFTLPTSFALSRFFVLVLTLKTSYFFLSKLFCTHAYCFTMKQFKTKKKKKKRIQITVVKNSQTIKPLYGCCKYFTHWNPADNKLFPEHYSTFPFIADLQSNRNWKRHWEVSFVCIKVDECERQQTQKLSGRWEKQPWCS